jgi:hypothetical protein
MGWFMDEELEIGHGLIETLSEYLFGSTEENRENLSQKSVFPGRVLKWIPPKYKYVALPLHQPPLYCFRKYLLFILRIMQKP